MKRRGVFSMTRRGLRRFVAYPDQSRGKPASLHGDWVGDRSSPGGGEPIKSK